MSEEPRPISDLDDREFADAVASEAAARKAEDDEWRRQQEAERVRDELCCDVASRLDDVAAGAPRGLGPAADDTFDVTAWSEQLMALAPSWKELHRVMDVAPLLIPVLSDQYGHEAGRRIFEAACRARTASDLARTIARKLDQVNVMRDVHLKMSRPYDGTVGIKDYFEILAFRFAERGLTLWEYDGRLPERMTVGQKVLHAHRSTPRARPPARSPGNDGSLPPARPKPQNEAEDYRDIAWFENHGVDRDFLSRGHRDYGLPRKRVPGMKKRYLYSEAGFRARWPSRLDDNQAARDQAETR